MLLDESGKIAEIELVPNNENIITFSKRGFIKRVAGETFQVQARGGTGKTLTLNPYPYTSPVRGGFMDPEPLAKISRRYCFFNSQLGCLFC